MEVCKSMEMNQVGRKGTVYADELSKEKWNLKKESMHRMPFLCTARGVKLGEMSSASRERDKAVDKQKVTSTVKDLLSSCKMWQQAM